MFKNIKRFYKSDFFGYFILSIVIILGLFLRLYKINNPIADWHSWRQADTASVTKIYVQKDINLLLPRYHDISSIQTGIFNPQGYRMVEFPVYNALHAILFESFPRLSLEVWGRLLTIFSALVTSIFLFLIGRKLMGRWGGVLAAAFYLFIPFNIYFTRVILPDPLGVSFAVISIWAFLEFSDGSNPIFFYVSAVFFGLAMLIKPYLGFYIFPIAYLAERKYGVRAFFKNRKVSLSTLAFLSISLVPFLIWRAWEAKFPQGIPFYEWAFNGSLIRFKPSFWYWIFGERLGHLILGSFGLIPFIFGILNIKVKNFFSHWLFVGALFYVTVVASANVMHDYYQILIIPSISLVLSAGSLYLWNQHVFNRVLTRGILIFSIGVMLVTGWNKIVGNYNINHPEILEAGREIDRIVAKDALVVAPYNGDTAFLYATGRSGWPAIDNSIDNIIKEGASYYVSVDLESKDTKTVESRFKTIEKTDKFIIIDLHRPLMNK